MIEPKAITILAALWCKVAGSRDVDEPDTSIQSAEMPSYQPPTQTEKNRAKQQRNKRRKSF